MFETCDIPGVMKNYYFLIGEHTCTPVHLSPKRDIWPTQSACVGPTSLTPTWECRHPCISHNAIRSPLAAASAQRHQAEAPRRCYCTSLTRLVQEVLGVGWVEEGRNWVGDRHACQPREGGRYWLRLRPQTAQPWFGLFSSTRVGKKKTVHHCKFR